MALSLGLSTGPSAAASRGRVEHPKSTPSGTLTISNESGSLWTCGFNPFNLAVQFTSAGFLYEPLVYVDALKNGATTPWLASSYAWSDGNKTLTFTIRKGVKWSDGKSLTAADVVFTFNMLKKYPALDLNSVWSVLKSVSQSGDNVVLTFNTAAVPYFYYVADQVFIVPQHIWASVKNPVTYADANPVATGPYTIGSCSGQNIKYSANTSYWQPGKPSVATVDYPAFTSNQPANTLLSTGGAQWGGQFIPSIKSFYTSKSSGNHYWFAPYVDVSLIPNLTDPQLKDLAVREAMAYAINRSRVSTIGEYGYEPPANQADIVAPTFGSWLDPSLVAKYDYSYDPSKAMSILEKDGYKKGSNGVFAKDGKELSLTAINIGGNSDWVAALQVIQSELAAVGIKITVDNLSGTDFDNDLFTGKYQLAYDDQTGGPSPYYELRQWLDSANTAPVGKIATTNWERYSNPATDALFNEYASTTSTAAQHQIIDKLEAVMLGDVPIIPMTEAVLWYQYNTSTFSGWVTSSNPYAEPAPYAVPDNEVVLLQLKAK
jgi:peptide/nickel transport system substrate-binding protein